MSRISLLDPTSAQGEAAKALASSIGHMGVFRALAHAHTNIVPLMKLGRSILAQQQLDAARRECLILLAMRLEGGAYEWAQHVEMALGVGVTRAQVDAIEALRLDEACFNAPERALLAFGRAVVEDVRIAEHTYATARAHFEQRELVEAVIAIGFYMLLARITEGFEVAPDPVQGMAVLTSAQGPAKSGG